MAKPGSADELRLGEAARRDHAHVFARALGDGWSEVERGIWEYDPARAASSEPPRERETPHLVPEAPTPSEPLQLLESLAGGLRRGARTLGVLLDDRFGDAAMRIAVETRDAGRRLARRRLR